MNINKIQFNARNANVSFLRPGQSWVQPHSQHIGNHIQALGLNGCQGREPLLKLPCKGKTSSCGTAFRANVGQVEPMLSPKSIESIPYFLLLLSCQLEYQLSFLVVRFLRVEELHQTDWIGGVGATYYIW